MKVEVLGSGCPSCKNLFDTVNRIIEENHIDADVEYVTDISRIVELGVMSSPVLVIDDEVIFAGAVPAHKELEEIIVNKK